MKKEVLCFNNISLGNHKDESIENLSFRIFEGEVCGILGMTGFEQKELIDLISGHKPLKSGSVVLHGSSEYRHILPKIPYSGIFYIDSINPLISDLSIADNFSLSFENYFKQDKYIKLGSRLTGTCKSKAFSKIYLNRKGSDIKIEPMTEALGWTSRFINYSTKNKRYADDVLKLLKINVQATKKARELSRFQQYQIAIVYAFISHARLIMISDMLEGCSPTEIEELSKLVQYLKKMGMSFLIISDNTDSIRAFCDSVLLFRRNNSKLIKTSELNDSSVLFTMFESDTQHYNNTNKNFDHKPDIRVDFSIFSDDLPLTIEGYKGEIIGIHDNNMQLVSYFSQLLYDMDLSNPCMGTFDNSSFCFNNLRTALKQKIAFLYEPIPTELLFRHRSFKDNICALSFDRVSIIKKTCISKKLQGIVTNDILAELNDNKSEQIDTINSLSDVDALKIVLARYLLLRPQILFCVRPFLHMDNAMKTIISRFLVQLSNNGTTIFLISNDYSVFSPICNRVFLLKNRQLSSSISTDQERMPESIHQLIDKFYFNN